MKKLMICVALVWLLVLANVTADDVLYATFGGALYTVDTQTGATTFVSDGPLQWLASPAFDEPHHTRLWIADRHNSAYGESYSWGNPFTGQSGGPYPATISYNDSAFSVWLTRLAVYAPTTERLYTIGSDGQTPSILVPIMIDQYEGPALPNWGRSLSLLWSVVGVTAIAFDPDSGLILVAVAVSSGGIPERHSFLLAFDPVTGLWADHSPLQIPDPPDPEYGYRLAVFVDALAVEPATGDLYFVSHKGFYATTMTFARIDRASGTMISIAEFPLDSWSMTFADGRYRE
jgi:hypothetical protein